MPSRLWANYNIYGWQWDRWLRPVYGGHQLIYAGLIHDHFGKNVDDSQKEKLVRLSFSQAVSYQEVRNMLSFIFGPSNLSLTDAGVLAVGSPLWRINNRIFRVSSISPTSLEGAILYRPNPLKHNTKLTFKDAHVLAHSEYLDKIASCTNCSNLPVLPRSDLKVYFFSTREAVNRISARVKITSGSQENMIEVSDGQAKLPLCGIEIPHFMNLGKGELGETFVFVIAPAFKEH